MECSVCEMLCKGAVGVAKAAAGIGCAPYSVVAERQRQCAACPHMVVTAIPFFGDVPRCSVCGCAIEIKTMLAEEECPLPEPEKPWGKVALLPKGEG